MKKLTNHVDKINSGRSIDNHEEIGIYSESGEQIHEGEPDAYALDVAAEPPPLEARQFERIYSHLKFVVDLRQQRKQR